MGAHAAAMVVRAAPRPLRIACKAGTTMVEGFGTRIPVTEYRDGSKLFDFSRAEALPAPARAANKSGKLHFIGIGGAGLSALARLAIHEGYTVAGSDASESYKLNRLREAGATVYVGHRTEQLAADTDAVIVSSAVPKTNPEFVAAFDQGIKVYKRDEWLAKVTEDYDLVACAGTHGKTSVSAMMAVVLRASGFGGGVSAVVGGDVAQFPGGDGTLEGDGTGFVLEADEYDGAFLGLKPAVAVVTNVEWDHVDIYDSEEAVRDTFRTFVGRCADDAGAASLSDAFAGEGGEGARAVMTYGVNDGADWQAVGITSNTEGGSDYILTLRGEYVTKVSLPVPGRHVVQNSLAVVAAAALLTAGGAGELPPAGLGKVAAGGAGAVAGSAQMAALALSGFEGVARRFQKIGEGAGGAVKVYDDYAHHPTEVRACLDSARQRFPGALVWAVFQPHTYSRLHQFLAEFGPSFAGADRLLVTDIFAARETNKWGVSAEQLVEIVTGTARPAEYVPDLPAVVDEVAGTIAAEAAATGKDVVLITMGAGTITSVGPAVLAAMEANP